MTAPIPTPMARRQCQWRLSTEAQPRLWKLLDLCTANPLGIATTRTICWTATTDPHLMTPTCPTSMRCQMRRAGRSMKACQDSRDRNRHPKPRLNRNRPGGNTQHSPRTPLARIQRPFPRILTRRTSSRTPGSNLIFPANLTLCPLGMTGVVTATTAHQKLTENRFRVIPSRTARIATAIPCQDIPLLEVARRARIA